MKKLIGIAAGLGMLLATVTPSFAATTTNYCENFTTGPNSTNVCVRLMVKLQRANINNSNATLAQTSTASTNSGGNTSDDNTTGGTVNAGEAEALAGNDTALNANEIELAQDDPAMAEEGSNAITGPDSINVVAHVTLKAVSVDVNNSGAKVTQTAIASAISGGNSASHNTIGGSVVTGKASAVSSNIAVVNSNKISISQ